MRVLVVCLCLVVDVVCFEFCVEDFVEGFEYGLIDCLKFEVVIVVCGKEYVIVLY